VASQLWYFCREKKRLPRGNAKIVFPKCRGFGVRCLFYFQSTMDATSGPRWRKFGVDEALVAALALLAAAAHSVSGRAVSHDEISSAASRSREICEPVSHDVLWLRLNMAPRLPVMASGPQVQQPYRRVDRQQPEVNIDFRSKRRRRETPEVGRRRRTRRQQRRQLRHWRKRLDALSDAASAPPWHCHVTRRWLRMPDDVFPPYVQTGSCAASRCMLGLYECRARKFATRVLRRLPGRCNPLPVIGDVTTGAGFEEAWAAEEYHVTVGCECVKRRESGWYDHGDS